MQPDYSRQMLLKEIGAKGQAALARARVLIVGLGGLGSPVLQYLAGAGVGYLGLVDADVLDASNVHRQPIYALSDVGKPKVVLARVTVTNINPSVQVETYGARLDADNALELIRAHDIVVDCSDNFRTKYLINDAAVLAQKPAVFASVYQYEGQLQVYKPEPKHACLRCLWPDAVADGVVGNCAEAGVLGPVPGTFGTLQALLTLKILLQLSGQLAEELLLLDFMNFSSVKIKAPRRVECVAPACAHIRELAREEPGIEIVLGSLAAAAERGLEVIDIRTAEEVAARPAGARHIPMANLLADPTLLEPAPLAPAPLEPARLEPAPLELSLLELSLLEPALIAPALLEPTQLEPTQLEPARQVLLVCATGKRSLAAAQQLRKRGIAVRSLAGGLQNLER